jgi:hypothetical protein
MMICYSSDDDGGTIITTLSYLPMSPIRSANSSTSRTNFLLNGFTRASFWNAAPVNVMLGPACFCFDTLSFFFSIH